MILLRMAAPLLLALSAGQAGVVTAKDAAPAAESAKILYYPVEADANKVYAQAVDHAKLGKVDAVIVFGADWCHDSRALAEVLTSDAFKSEFGSRYEVTFIDVGRPQSGEGRNLDLVKQLGVKNLKSTPAMFVLSPGGKLLNGKKDAVSWRNAQSRGPDKVLTWFRGFDKRHG
jgi:thiol-disulfide isomerase/thioredoxin